MPCLLLLLWLLAACLPVTAEYLVINKPGQTVDVAAKVVPGKQNLVVFHSANYPVSRRMISEYKALGDRRADLAVLVVDINLLGSAVAKQYNITYVPAVRFYDDKGKLTMEGMPAYNESVKLLSSGR